MDNLAKDKVICLMVVGNKYQQQYDKQKKGFSEYAKRCNADLVIIREPLDKGFHRPLLSQKLLIPSQLRDYKIGVFLDLDILISDKAPSIFDFLTDDKSFGAILDPRGTNKFNETWKHIPRILSETTQDYFVDRNFKASNELQGSINGGVFIFRPNDISRLFSDYYFSDHNQGEHNSFEETPMAYLTQINGIFQAIDTRFNAQVLYEIKGTAEGKKVLESEKKIPKIIRNYFINKLNTVLYPTKRYKVLINSMIDHNYFVHFAGNYPIVKIKK